MACSKYTLTNTGSTIVNFSYRRCDDSMWDYQVELLPNQTKNIWVINGTYTVAPSFKNTIYFVDNGPFPPISATNTPTPSPTVTPTNTATPTNTELTLLLQVLRQQGQELLLRHLLIPQHQLKHKLKHKLLHQQIHQLILKLQHQQIHQVKHQVKHQQIHHQ